MTSKRDVQIGRDAIGVVFTAGDHNTVEAHVAAFAAPQIDPGSIDITKELAAIRQILAAQPSEHANKIGRALDDADEEATKHDKADRHELGGALDRALRLAKSASGFTEVAAKLMPHVRNTVAWLGERWAALLGYLA